MKRAWVVVGTCAGWIAASGAVWSATQHTSLVTGLYWACSTATTVGYGDVVPRTASGQLLAIGVMVTAIPLLAAAFALVTGGRLLREIAEHITKRLDEHHRAIHARLDSIERKA